MCSSFNFDSEFGEIAAEFGGRVEGGTSRREKGREALCSYRRNFFFLFSFLNLKRLEFLHIFDKSG